MALALACLSEVEVGGKVAKRWRILVDKQPWPGARERWRNLRNTSAMVRVGVEGEKEEVEKLSALPFFEAGEVALRSGRWVHRGRGTRPPWQP